MTQQPPGGPEGPGPRRRPHESPHRPGALRIARIAGVPVYIHASWVFIAVIIAYAFAPVVESYVPGLGTFRYVAAFGFAVLLYGSILVHEIAHVVVARAFRLPVRSVTLQFLGGVSEIDGEPQTPWRECAVAIVGPITSLALGAAAFGVERLVGGPRLLQLTLLELAFANLLVGLFNLVPGLPLDGGRVLRAAVWGITHNPLRATIVAGWAGRVVAVGVLVLPWAWYLRLGTGPGLFNVIWSFFIAMFLWAGSTQALRSVEIRRRLPALRARSLARRALPVTPDTSLAVAVQRAQESLAGALVVVDGDGRPTGLVSEAAVVATPEHRRPWVSVSDLSRRIEPGLILQASLTGEPLVRAMTATPASEYLVVESDGGVYGVLSTVDVDQAFARA